LYFGEHGITSSVTDRLEEPPGYDPYAAIVVFPDEFTVESAASSIEALARRFSHARIVVVTRQVSDFESLLADIDAGALGRLRVLPRPVWGWELLDQSFS
jgi:hypothetical protein